MQKVKLVKNNHFNLLIFSGITSLCLLIASLMMMNHPAKKTLSAIRTLSDSIPESDIIVPQEDQKKASIVVNHLCFKEFQKNKDLEITIEAQECSVMENTENITCSHLNCILSEKKVAQAHLETEHAIVNRNKKIIYFTQHVHGAIKDLMFSSSQVVYDFAAQTLKAHAPSHYEHPSFSIEAPQSFINLKTNIIEFSGGVRSTFQL